MAKTKNPIIDTTGYEVHVVGACMEGRELDAHISVARTEGPNPVGLTFTLDQAKALAKALAKLTKSFDVYR